MKKTIFQELTAMLLVNVVHVKTSAITDTVDATEAWTFPDEHFAHHTVFHRQPSGFITKKNLLL